jgi:hypothetical protein
VDTQRIAETETLEEALDRICPVCIGGWVYIGFEEDGCEHIKVIPCRRCRGDE